MNSLLLKFSISYMVTLIKKIKRFDYFLGSYRKLKYLNIIIIELTTFTKHILLPNFSHFFAFEKTYILLLVKIF